MFIGVFLLNVCFLSNISLKVKINVGRFWMKKRQSEALLFLHGDFSLK